MGFFFARSLSWHANVNQGPLFDILLRPYDLVHMSTTENHFNNIRLRQLIEQAGITQADALKLFNRGQAKSVTESGFKAWLAARDSVRWRVLSDDYLRHAEKVFSRLTKTHLI